MVFVCFDNAKLQPPQPPNMRSSHIIQFFTCFSQQSRKTGVKLLLCFCYAKIGEVARSAGGVIATPCSAGGVEIQTLPKEPHYIKTRYFAPTKL